MGPAHHGESPGFSSQSSSKLGLPPLRVTTFITLLQVSVATVTLDHIVVVVVT
jgi:hypothetical protein